MNLDLNMNTMPAMATMNANTAIAPAPAAYPVTFHYRSNKLPGNLQAPTIAQMNAEARKLLPDIFANKNLDILYLDASVEQSVYWTTNNEIQDAFEELFDVDSDDDSESETDHNNHNHNNHGTASVVGEEVGGGGGGESANMNKSQSESTLGDSSPTSVHILIKTEPRAWLGSWTTPNQSDIKVGIRLQNENENENEKKNDNGAHAEETVAVAVPELRLFARRYDTNRYTKQTSLQTFSIEVSATETGVAIRKTTGNATPMNAVQSCNGLMYVSADNKSLNVRWSGVENPGRIRDWFRMRCTNFASANTCKRGGACDLWHATDMELTTLKIRLKKNFKKAMAAESAIREHKRFWLGNWLLERNQKKKLRITADRWHQSKLRVNYFNTRAQNQSNDHNHNIADKMPEIIHLSPVFGTGQRELRSSLDGLKWEGAMFVQGHTLVIHWQYFDRNAKQTKSENWMKHRCQSNGRPWHTMDKCGFWHILDADFNALKARLSKSPSPSPLQQQRQRLHQPQLSQRLPPPPQHPHHTNNHGQHMLYQQQQQRQQQQQQYVNININMNANANQNIIHERQQQYIAGRPRIPIMDDTKPAQKTN